MGCGTWQAIKRGLPVNLHEIPPVLRIVHGRWERMPGVSGHDPPPPKKKKDTQKKKKKIIASKYRRGLHNVAAKG